MMIDFHDGHDDEQDELFQVTAMVDVVFILLAFFVLSVQFHGSERDLTLGYVEAGPPSGAAAEDFPPEIVVRLAGTADHAVSITVGETPLPDDGYDELTAILTRIDVPSIPVVLAADPSLTVQQVADAMDAVLASPMTRLSLARLRAPETP